MNSSDTQWWKVVLGIISIPAGLIGIYYSFVLIKKTRLEAEKTKLEILEKQDILRRKKIRPTVPSKKPNVHFFFDNLKKIITWRNWYYVMILSASIIVLSVGVIFLFKIYGTVIVEKPILSSPGNGISMPQNTDVTLLWNPSKGAVQYEVEAWGGPYTMMTPCIWQGATLCHIGQMAPGTISWRVKARNDKGQESEWSDTWSFQFEVIPGYVELVDDLQLTTPAGNWPPNKGDKLIAHIHIRNGGDQPLQIVHIGVKGRRNGNEYWDIGFWSITLNGNEPWSSDPHNERPLESGEYSFQLTYSLDGTTWELLGSEYKFTIP